MSAWLRRLRGRKATRAAEPAPPPRAPEPPAAPPRESVATDIGSQGGAVGRQERAKAEAALDAGTRTKGAGVDVEAAKHGPPKETVTINPEQVTVETTNTLGRRKLDLNPATKPLAIGAAAAGSLAALGYAASKIGDAVAHSDDEQLPYTQQLPGGGLLYTDPVTGETYVIVLKDGGGTHEDPNGQTPDPNGEGGGYEVIPVSEGNRADAEAQKDIAEGLFNPWVLLAIVAAIIVIAVVVAKSKGGGKK